MSETKFDIVGSVKRVVFTFGDISAPSDMLDLTDASPVIIKNQAMNDCFVFRFLNGIEVIRSDWELKPKDNF